ncbi:MAG: FAD-binding oxidoreductase [Rhodobacteraceae bacterium]|nr:FAD-binding oxidoreductase [Paracoccaceae bacterium]
MRRLYSDYAYGPGPRDNCWWDQTIAEPDWPVLTGTMDADVAIIGGGFTGISAALHLAQAGASVVVLEAESPGWGASGRNGGFCCLGGSKLSSAAMQRRFGDQATKTYEASEVAAVSLVRELLDKYGINADSHSRGETQLAHSPRAMQRLRVEAEDMARNGQKVDLLEADQLAEQGLNGPFHGGLTTPVGFGLNPRKYLFGLCRSAQTAGAQLFQRSGAGRISQRDGKHVIATPNGILRVSQVIIATNGYSSEDLPSWLAGRYLPTQSTVMVTRVLSEDELQKQGWFSDQMAYDSRNLLHYFRLMPDRRFLFGMRGGLLSSARSEQAIRHKLRRDFDHMFAAWKDVETTHCWSGMVCLARNLVPFVGPVPEVKGMFAGLCYHGNGVAMGTYAGRLLSDLVLGQTSDLPYSPAIQSMPRFPLGRFRRLLMPPAYAALGMMD